MSLRNAIVGILDFENWVQLSSTEIAKELQIHRQHISRAMKVLEEKEIILRGPKIGRSYAFMLNPEFGWKGKVKNLDDYRKQKEDEENQRKNQERYKENLKSAQLSKEDQLIMAIKEKKVDIEKFYQLMTKDQKTDNNSE